MRVFLSWSGPRSRAAAEAFKHLLHLIFSTVEPWNSTETGSRKRWSGEISNSLANTNFGVVFVTPSNQHAPWLLFESGALAKSVEDDARVVLYLLDGMKFSNL